MVPATSVPSVTTAPPSTAAPPAARGAWWAALCVFSAFLLLYLLGNGSHQLWDRDEPRYGVATREMIASGDWLIPHFNGEIRYEKPVLIYWLMSVPMRLFGPTDFAARFVQALAGAGAMGFLFLLSLRLGSTLGGAIAACLCAGLSPLVIAVSKSATIDAALLFAILVTLHSHAGNMRHGFAWWRHVVFWISCGMAILLKGPAGPAVIASAVLGERIWSALDRRRGHDSAEGSPPTGTATAALRTSAGFLLLAAVVAPWVIAAWVRTNGDFFLVQFREHALSHAVTGKEGHTGPLYYYLPVLALSAGCAAPLLAMALPWAWQARVRREVRMLIAWFLGTLVIFSFAGTKLPHYMVPAIAAWGAAGGLCWSSLAASRGAHPPHRVALAIGCVLLALLGIGIAAALAYSPRLGPFPGIRTAAWITAGAVAIGFPASAYYWWNGKWSEALTFGAGAWVFACGVLALGLLPALEPIRPSRNLANWIEQNAPGGTEIMAVDFQEPSLVFYSGRQVTMLGKSEGREAMDRLLDTSRPCALVIPNDRLQRWLSYGRDGQLPPGISVKHTGRYYDFQSGDGWMILLVVGNWDAAAGEPSS